MKVLFIGNSHTFFNDMPELFAQFVEKTTGEKPQVTMLAYSGRELAWHRKEYFSLRFCTRKGVPYLPVETGFSDADTGQIITRVSAFIEML